MDRSLEARCRRHLRIAGAIARIGDAELVARLGGARARDAWGRTQVVELGGTKVFVKRIPISDVELDAPYSTRNHFRLPSYYHYGVGSAGFGVFREVLAHAEATRWVLAGRTEGFPLLHHHRILRHGSRAQARSGPELASYVRYWNGSKRIERFIEARSAATAEALLFLEHVPHTAAQWLVRRTHRFPWLVAEARSAIELLRRERMLHLDVHARNLLTDGERVYLGDFGLALSLDFELGEEERRFFALHQRFDEGELFYSLGAHLLTCFQHSSGAQQAAMAARYGLPQRDRIRMVRGLLDHLDEIAARREMNLDAGYVALTLRYRPVIALMSEFFGRMIAGPDKRFRFDHAALARALRRADPEA
jgi:hypothetical protein